MRNDFRLHEPEARAVLRHVGDLWGNRVELRGVDPESGYRLYSYDAEPEA